MDARLLASLQPLNADVRRSLEILETQYELESAAGKGATGCLVFGRDRITKRAFSSGGSEMVFDGVAPKRGELRLVEGEGFWGIGAAAEPAWIGGSGDAAIVRRRSQSAGAVRRGSDTLGLESRGVDSLS